MSSNPLHYSSHLPVLMRAVTATTGPVLELGTGYYSTPVLHWLCAGTQRRLVSYEHHQKYAEWAQMFQAPWHEVAWIEEWDRAPIDQPWDVAFIDHGPSARRAVDLRRLAPYARFVVLHDTDGRLNKLYGYPEVYPCYRYNVQWTRGGRPYTNVLSNTVDPTSVLPW